MTTSIIIVAAGQGTRLGEPKVFAKLAGKTLLEHNLHIIHHLSFVDEIVVVVSDDHRERAEKIAQQCPHQNVKVVTGGAERIDSVKAGLEACVGQIVLIQNVANPMARSDDFESLHATLVAEDAACFVAQQAVDTLRRVQDEHIETIDRNHVWRVQTPQGFRRHSLETKLAEHDGSPITDEIMLFEGTEVPVMPFPTSSLNQKVTFPHDLEVMEQYLSQEVLMGIGEDSHRFDSSGRLMLGGIQVEGMPKLKGNSDGDVILHALFNAISSALGGRSISKTADPLVKEGITDSTAYLKGVLQQSKQRGYAIRNISISLECAQPRIEPMVDKLKDRLSALVEVQESRIGITATSGEDLTSFGRGEGVRCSCVVSLLKTHHE